MNLAKLPFLRNSPIASDISGRTITVTIVQAVGVGTAMGAQVLLARLLGIEQFGHFALALSFLLLGSGIGRAGLETVSIRFVAAYQGTADWGRLAGVLHFARRAGFATALAASAIGVVATLIAWDRLSPPLGWTLLVASAGGLVFVPAQIVQAQLRGLHLPIAGQLPEPLLRSAGLAALAGLLWLAIGPFPAAIAMAANVSAMALVLAVSLFMLRRALPASTRTAARVYERGEWMRVGAAALLINVAGLIVSQADIVAVGLFSGAADAGAYAAATRLAALVVFVLSGANVVMGPLISQLFNQGKMEELQRSTTFVCRAMAAIAVPTAAALALLAGPLLSLFGAEFERATTALLILAIGQVLNAVTGPCALLLTMTKHHNVTAVAQLGLVAGNVLLLALLVPRFGIEGAAWSRVGMLVVENLLYVFLVKRFTGIRSTPV